MKIYRFNKFKMHLTKEKEELIIKTIGNCSFVYNYFLGKKVSNAYSGIKLIPEL